MKHYFKCILLLSFILSSVVTMAAKDKSLVNLVVSAEAPTKQEAITNALRNAIEQACGVFLSNSSIIENDELKIDRIAAVTSGNIASYKEIDCLVDAEGRYFVTLEANVSIKHIMSYSQQNQMSSLIEGSAIFAHKKMVELNRKNTEIAFQNLFDELTEQTKGLLFDHQIINQYMGVNSQENEGKIRLIVHVLENSNTQNFVKTFISTMKALAIDKKEAKSLMEEGYKLFSFKTMGMPKSYYYSMFTQEQCDKLNKAIRESFNNFLIQDNLGEFYHLPQLKENNLMEFRPGTYFHHNHTNHVATITSKEVDKRGKEKEVVSKYKIIESVSFSVWLPLDYLGNITSFERIVPTETDLERYRNQKMRTLQTDAVLRDSLNNLILAKPTDPDHAVLFVAASPNSSVGLKKLSSCQTLEYSYDATTWHLMEMGTNITLKNQGDRVYIRGLLTNDPSAKNNTQFMMLGKIIASGNCSALWNYKDVDAPLRPYCGFELFKDCQALNRSPRLPATQLAYKCYSYMFSDCASLFFEPELPATQIPSYAYECTFWNCTSLTSSPVLPALHIEPHAYQGLFNGCTNLNQIVCFADNINSSTAYAWVDHITTSGTYYKQDNVTAPGKDMHGVPMYWKVKNYIPIKPQTQNKTVYYCTANSLRVRQAPSSDASVVGFLSLGQTVEIIRRTDEFFEIKFKHPHGTTGWVSNQYISSKQVENNNTQK